MNTISQFIGDNRWHVQVWIVLAACLVAYFLLRFVVIKLLISNFVRRQMKRKTVAAVVDKKINTLVQVSSYLLVLILVLVAVFIIFGIYEISITASVAGLGVIGLAIGFGAQSLLQDWVKGFFILAENQYDVGDVIKVGDIMGVVEDISLRKTVLRDLDGAKHIIPHGQIGVVSNYTQEWARAHLDISVAYKEDLDRVMDIMKNTWEELAQDPEWAAYIISKSPSVLRVNEFADSGIYIKIVGDTQPIQQWSIMGEYRRRIKRVFDKEKIEMPWPHTMLYFGESLKIDKPAEK